MEGNSRQQETAGTSFARLSRLKVQEETDVESGGDSLCDEHSKAYRKQADRGDATSLARSKRSWRTDACCNVSNLHTTACRCCFELNSLPNIDMQRGKEQRKMRGLTFSSIRFQNQPWPVLGYFTSNLNCPRVHVRCRLNYSMKQVQKKSQPSL